MGATTLLDRALDAAGAAVDRVAVNVHHGRDQLLDALRVRPEVHVSVEEGVALGTAGGVGALADWLDGAGVLVVNADTVHDADLAAFVGGWDGERVALLTPTPGPFGPRSGVVASLLPSTAVARLAPVPSGLWEVLWRDEVAAGRVVTVHHAGQFIDCGTSAQYLAANLAVTGGSAVASDAEVLGHVAGSVVGSGAVVGAGAVVERSVVWPGAVVHPGERLVDAIRADHVTVLVR